MVSGGLVPDHVLVIPIGHIPCFVACPPSVRAEMTRFFCILKFSPNLEDTLMLLEKCFLKRKS